VTFEPLVADLQKVILCGVQPFATQHGKFDNFVNASCGVRILKIAKIG
jgi:hypothetical protein